MWYILYTLNILKFNNGEKIMMFNNATKLFFANFSIFWKVLLYKIIAIGVCMLLFLPVLTDWTSALTEVHFGTVLMNFATNTAFTNLSNTFEQLFVLGQSFLKAVQVLLSFNVFAVVYAILLLVIILPFLLRLSKLPTQECIYSYMASLTKPGFTSTFISKIGASCVYSLFKTLFMISTLAVIVFGMYGLLQITQIDGIIKLFLPLLALTFIAVVLAFSITCFAGWAPAVIVFNKTPLRSLKQGFKAVFKKFFKLLSTIGIIIVITVSLMMLFSTISLFIIFPLTILLLDILEMVSFFGSQGMRFYVDLDTIITPKKLEECDKFNKVINII